MAPAAIRGAESPGTVAMTRSGWPSGTLRSRPPRDSERTYMPGGSPLRHRARMRVPVASPSVPPALPTAIAGAAGQGGAQVGVRGAGGVRTRNVIV